MAMAATRSDFLFRFRAQSPKAHRHCSSSSSSSSSGFSGSNCNFWRRRGQFPSLSLSLRPNTRFAVACASSSSEAESSVPPTRLYVSGLSFRTTEESLRNAFKDFGQLVEVKLVMDRIANRPRGFAFLGYDTEEESQKAIEGMHGKFLDGRVIFVEVARPRGSTNPNPRPRY